MPRVSELGRSWQKVAVLQPVIQHVEPAKEGMDQGPEYTVIGSPAQQGGEDGPDAAEDAAATAPATFVFVIVHLAPLSWFRPLHPD
jgi:hypothetical protein